MLYFMSEFNLPIYFQFHANVQPIPHFNLKNVLRNKVKRFYKIAKQRCRQQLESLHNE